MVLSLTSSQYTSRVLRTFMRDRVNQVVLGVFVGIFAYCLVVLRTIRGPDEGAFVPALAMLGGLSLAFVGIAFLIYFIHHVSMSIQASSIIAMAAEETIGSVDHLFPRGLGEDAEDGEAGPGRCLVETAWTAGPARKTGYIESVDPEALLAVARERGTLVRMDRGIGEFVIDGAPLLSVAGPGGLDDEATVRLSAAYLISRQRTVQQDAAFGIRQIVDIAMKALSPGVNDSTTAVMCVDYLAAILVRLASRRIATPHRREHGELRVIARGPSFEGLLAEAFDQIRRLLEALQTIAGSTTSARRLRAVQQHAGLVAAVAGRAVTSPRDAESVEAAVVGLARILEATSRERAAATSAP